MWQQKLATNTQEDVEEGSKKEEKGKLDTA